MYLILLILGNGKCKSTCTLATIQFVSLFSLFQYLDALFDRDPRAGSEFHERQVQLYADYDKKKLLPFLRACNDIPLKKVSSR